MYREVYVTHFLFSPSKTKDRLTFGYIIFYHELPVKAEPTSQAVLLPASEQESALGHPCSKKTDLHQAEENKWRFYSSFQEEAEEKEIHDTQQNVVKCVH